MARIAFLLLAHKEPETILTLANHLTAAGHYVVVSFKNEPPLISSRWCLGVWQFWQFIFQLFSAINGPKRSLLCPIALNNMASILQVPTLTIVLLSDVCLVQNWLWLVHNLLLCIDVDIQYFLYMMPHIISSKPNEHKTFDIISISFTHIIFKASTMELCILIIYCNASYAHWIIRANLCCEI